MARRLWIIGTTKDPDITDLNEYRRQRTERLAPQARKLLPYRVVSVPQRSLRVGAPDGAA